MTTHIQIRRALCVDYSSSNLHLLANILEGSGFECDKRTTAVDALKLLENTDYTIIFVNLRPADMDGVEFIKAIRHADGCSPVTTVVGTTTSKIKSEHERFIEAGCDQILVRPFQLSEVVDIVEGDGAKGPAPDNSNIYFLDLDLELSAEPRKELLDAGVLGQLVSDIGGEHVLEAINIFASELDSYRDRIDAAMRADNSEDVAAGAHTVKSAAEALGVRNIARSAEDLETACRMGAEGDDVQQLCKALVRHVSRFKDYLENADLSEFGLSSTAVNP